MFRGFRSGAPATTTEPLPAPPLDLRVPAVLETATFGVG